MSNETLELLRSFDIFFDIEAAGLGDGTYPIEVGISGEGIRYEALIKPDEKWTYWSSQAQKIHGISRKQLAKEGKPIEVVCAELNALLKGQTIYSDSKFDPFWLDTLFDQAGIEAEFKYINLTRYLPEEYIQKLAFELPQGDRIVHRAFPDADDLRDAWHRVVKWVERHTAA